MRSIPGRVRFFSFQSFRNEFRTYPTSHAIGTVSSAPMEGRGQLTTHIHLVLRFRLKMSGYIHELLWFAHGTLHLRATKRRRFSRISGYHSISYLGGSKVHFRSRLAILRISVIFQSSGNVKEIYYNRPLWLLVAFFPFNYSSSAYHSTQFN